MTLRLPDSVAAWESPAFPATLKRELEAQATLLPLQQELSSGSVVSGDRIEVMVIAAEAEPVHIHARVGIFFSGIIAGCSCADDPTPVESQSEYCELLVSIDRATAAATVSLDD
ncbi:MAG: hypothetical protein KJ634_10025 [Gammaproteobacteria bacterium]|nr:hypothetical protein [Gammaproteobacteria bacterium]MBU1415948.1 hypothetical protein [Gammaproteobacteria bacterium]